MVDFDEWRSKAEAFLEDHADQVDSGIDKAADFAGNKYGHGAQIDEGADKLKEFLPGGEQDERPERRPGTGRGRSPGGPRRGPGRRGGPGRPGGSGKPADG